MNHWWDLTLTYNDDRSWFAWDRLLSRRLGGTDSGTTFVLLQLGRFTLELEKSRAAL